MCSSNKKIIVAMSGGVDSSVSALLLKQQGFAVEGLFMKNWEEDDTETYCAATQDVQDAQAVCDKLQIPLHTVNFAAEYWDNVFENFLQEYQAGRTPNPDILCNREIKFKVCLQHAQNLGAAYFATGHYAQINYQDSKYWLLRGNDEKKDQTYFLYTLNQDILAKTLFPIGDLPKPQVRQLATQAGLVTSAKKDSTGICFIGERRFKTFLAQYLPAQPGIIETTAGDKIGRHDGLMYYTLGQRQGLKIGGTKSGNGKAWYVVAKNVRQNTLIVGQGHDHPLLFSPSLICEQIHWITDAPEQYPVHCSAKIRYQHVDQSCYIEKIAGNRYSIVFNQPQWAITPGQSIVFYDKTRCLGGSIIVSPESEFTA